MFVTEKMRKVSLFFPSEDMTRFWDKLGRFGSLQPGELRRVEKLQSYLSFLDLGELSGKLREISGFLDVDLTSPIDNTETEALELLDLKARLDELAPAFAEVRGEMRTLRESQRNAERALDRLATHKAHLEMLAPLEVDIGALLHLERFSVMAGTLSKEKLDALDRSLQGVPHALLPYRTDRGWVQLLVICLNKDRAKTEKVLDSALFQHLDLPEDLHGSPHEALKGMEEQRVDLTRRLEELARRGKEIEEWKEEKRAELGDFLKMNASLLGAREGTGQTHAVAVASGWIPARQVEELDRLVKDEPTWVLEGKEVPYKNNRDEDGFTVPSKLRNPSFFRAFEGLVKLYGIPRYGGFDPTIIFSLTFIFMFGMMFGDLGHGAILFMAGLALRFWPRLRESLRRNGTILASVGASAMVFGVLYGSFFGYDNIIPALWFRPMTRINQLLMYAIFIGIGVILVGIFINITVKLMQRRYLEVIFERFGVLGLWFYLGALFMVYLYSKGSAFSIWLVFVLMFLPLLLMPLERPLAKRVKGGKQHASEEGETLLVTVLVTAVDLFETMIVYLSNSISFVRVAAFALNHVALSLAIFQLGAMLRTLPGGGVLYVLTVAGGNLMILLLEGGIVGIQALRLEFYEFFSKFFEAEGTMFQPFQFVFSKKEVDRA